MTESLLDLRLQRVVPGVTCRHQLAKAKLYIRIHSARVCIILVRNRERAAARNGRNRGAEWYEGAERRIYLLDGIKVYAARPNVAYAHQIVLVDRSLECEIVLIRVRYLEARIYRLRKLKQRRRYIE